MIRYLYQLLQKIYGLQLAYRLEDFLLSPRQLKASRHCQRPEVLLIFESGSVLEMGLYIDPLVRLRLKKSIMGFKPEDICCAAEGLSHFLYIMDRVLRNRTCSFLELELQAEVDKFLLLSLVGVRANSALQPEYFKIIFENYSLVPNLSAEEEKRYHLASRYAAKYCAYLRDSFFYPLQPAPLVSEVRSFFYKNLSEKIQRLTP